MTMMTPMGQGGRMYPRSRRWPRVLAVLVVVALLAIAGAGLWWWLAREPNSQDGREPTVTKTCRTPAPVTPKAIPSPEDVAVDVANGTDQGGLAIETADTLLTRGFSVVGIGNTDRPVKLGVAQVRYAPAEYAGAIRLASYVPGSQLVAVSGLKGGVVEFWIGPDFVDVVTSNQADVSAVELPTPAPICRKPRTNIKTLGSVSPGSPAAGAPVRASQYPRAR